MCYVVSLLGRSGNPITDAATKYQVNDMSGLVGNAPKTPNCEGGRGEEQVHLMITSSNGNISALLALCEGNHWSPVDSPHKGQWRGSCMFSLICARSNGGASNRDASDLGHHRAHYDVNVMAAEIHGTQLLYKLLLSRNLSLSPNGR